MSSSPETLARSTTMATGGLPGLVRATARQTSIAQRAVRHDAQPVVRADGRDRAGLPGAEHAAGDPAR